MIADPFREGEKLSYCKHNKIPKVIVRTKYQNEAIRLQDKSKLKQLGSRENRICRDCNERVCCCLWSRREQRPTNSLGIEPANNLQRDIVKSWNFRHTILDKFRSSHNNRHLPHKDSAIWILKPIKKMYTSETNLIDTKQSSISMSKSTVLKKSVHNLSKISLESKGSNDRVQSWRSGSHKQEFNSTIGKDTKEYFNIRKKKLFEVINAEDQQKKKLIEEELGKRYNELDELSKYATQNAERKLTTLDILQNTMLRLVRGTDLAEKQKELPGSTIATKCTYENKEKSSEKSSDCALETAEKSLKKLQEGLNELIPAKIKEYNDNKYTLKSKSLQEIKEIADDISITKKLPPALKEPKINGKLRNFSEKKTPNTQILTAKPKQPHRSKSKISRTRKQRKQKRAKKQHSPKKENIQKIMSSTSLILEESQLNFQSVKIEETLSNETITREAAHQQQTEYETADPSPPMLFDPSELSVVVNQIYLESNETPSNDADADDEQPSSTASQPPVITVANGTFSIYFHTPINKNILCKSCGY